MAIQFKSVADLVARLHSDHLQHRQSMIRTVANNMADKLTQAAVVVDKNAKAKIGKTTTLESGGLRTVVTQSVHADPNDPRLKMYISNRDKIVRPNLSELRDLLSRRKI